MRQKGTAALVNTANCLPILRRYFNSRNAFEYVGVEQRLVGLGKLNPPSCSAQVTQACATPSLTPTVPSIIRRELMPSFAVSFTGIHGRATDPAQDVRPIGHRLKVGRINARRVATYVIQHKSARHRPHDHTVRIAMAKVERNTSAAYPSIPTRPLTGRPIPTPCFCAFTDALKEPWSELRCIHGSNICNKVTYQNYNNAAA